VLLYKHQRCCTSPTLSLKLAAAHLNNVHQHTSLRNVLYVIHLCRAHYDGYSAAFPQQPSIHDRLDLLGQTQAQRRTAVLVQDSRVPQPPGLQSTSHSTAGPCCCHWLDRLAEPPPAAVAMAAAPQLSHASPNCLKSSAGNIRHTTASREYVYLSTVSRTRGARKWQHSEAAVTEECQRM
jgi:hypothetical protein